MQNVTVIKGRLIDSKHIELEEPIANMKSEIEVIVRSQSERSDNGHGKLSDFLNALPLGTRHKEDIDRQIRDERDAWGETR